MTPLEIIAAAIREVWHVPVTPGFAEGWAKVAAVALTDPAIVANAAQALEDDGSIQIYGGHRRGFDFEHAARVVLRSVGGA